MVAPGSFVAGRCKALLGAALSFLFLSAALAGCPGSTCATGQKSCGGVCTNVATDNANCGACGNACAAGEVCSKGTCGLSCTKGTTACGQLCVDTKTDPAHCGTCAHGCPAGQVCSNGSCTLACNGGTTQCGQSCVDTHVDPAHCGGCNTVCTGGKVCSNGSCTLSCVGGTTECGGVCTNTNLDPANCGGCSQPCGSMQSCVNGSCYYHCAVGATQPETACNGKDDNCNGTVDEGCPKTLTLPNRTAVATSTLYGDTGGTAWGPDTCAAGSAVVGIYGDGGGNIDRFGLVCAPVTMTIDTSTAVYTYPIAIGSQTNLPIHGQNVTNAYRIVCPAGQVVTRIDGVYDATARGTGSGAVPAGVHQLSVYCSKVTIGGTPTHYAIVTGAPTFVGQEKSGYNLTGSQTFSFACPSGTAYVGGASGRAGFWLDALQLRCYAPVLTLE